MKNLHFHPSSFSRSQLNNSSHHQSSLLQASHILEETDNFIVESFGATLPVAVTEILTLSESKKYSKIEILS